MLVLCFSNIQKTQRYQITKYYDAYLNNNIRQITPFKSLNSWKYQISKLFWKSRDINKKHSSIA